MSILDSIGRNIRNIFVGSHKGDDISNEWSHPHDSMPIANGTNRYASPEKMTEIESNPRPEEEIADWFDESDAIEYGKSYASRHKSTPDFEKTAEEVVTMHEKMYRIATAKYNPFAIGGSESLGGGSEEHIEEPPDL
tara:strand:- start:809 stop:1219 length:411 start_codon:yes stop_codon:yes gene_type:complete